MATNSGLPGAPSRVRIVRYMECRRNLAAHNPTSYVLDGCRAFEKSGPVGTPEFVICATCGCDRNNHRKEEYLPDQSAGNHPLHCLAAAAAAVAAPLPPLPPLPPRVPLRPQQPPFVPGFNHQLPINYGGGGSETLGWVEVGEGSKPLKKRRVEGGQASSSSSTPGTGV